LEGSDETIPRKRALDRELRVYRGDCELDTEDCGLPCLLNCIVIANPGTAEGDYC